MPTGMPLYFNCWKCRRRPCTTLSHSGRGGALRISRCKHTQRLTGRIRPYKGTNLQNYMLRVSYEYVCDCGHKGWSRVPDVKRLPLTPS